MPESCHVKKNEEINTMETFFNNEWSNPFGKLTNPPSESDGRQLIRKVIDTKINLKSLIINLIYF